MKVIKYDVIKKLYYLFVSLLHRFYVIHEKKCVNVSIGE